MAKTEEGRKPFLSGSDKMARKQENFKLPKGMLEEVDRFIAENPGMGFEDRGEVLKTALREYLLGGGKKPVPEPKTPEPVKAEKPKASEEKINRLIIEMLVYDVVWADLLDKDEAKQKANPRAFYYPGFQQSPRGKSRIVSKNIDQWDILEKVIEKDLNKAEIEYLRDFMKYYGQNFEKMKPINDKIRENLAQKEKEQG